MEFVTKYDIGQYFLVDHDVTKVVVLTQVAGNGWGTVKQKDGTYISLNLDRLTPARSNKKENPDDQVKQLVPPVDTIESIKVKFRSKDGGTIIKTLQGKDAEQWHKWIQEVCSLAELYKLNPEWTSLGWKITKQR